MSDQYQGQFLVHHGGSNASEPLSIDEALARAKIMLLAGKHNLLITHSGVTVTAEPNDFMCPSELVLHISLEY